MVKQPESYLSTADVPQWPRSTRSVEQKHGPTARRLCSYFTAVKKSCRLLAQHSLFAAVRRLDRRQHVGVRASFMWSSCKCDPRSADVTSDQCLRR